MGQHYACHHAVRLQQPRLHTQAKHCQHGVPAQSQRAALQARRHSHAARQAALHANAESLAAQRSRLHLALVGQPQAEETDNETFGLVQEASIAADEADAELESQAMQQWRSFMKASRSMQVQLCADATQGR